MPKREFGTLAEFMYFVQADLEELLMYYEFIENVFKAGAFPGAGSSLHDKVLEDINSIPGLDDIKAQ